MVKPATRRDTFWWDMAIGAVIGIMAIIVVAIFWIALQP